MPAPALPPMTTRQAKRNNKNNPIKFKYTASQMRRADRIDELEERRRGLEDQERRRKFNRRKRDEQSAKNRETQRKMLREGKISIEETWGKVAASQPRLNSFFTKRVTRQQSALRRSTSDSEKENRSTPVKLEGAALVDKCPEHEYDSQEDTLVEKPKAQDTGQDPNEIADADLLELLSPLPVENISASAPALPSSPSNSLETRSPRKDSQQTSRQTSSSKPTVYSPRWHHPSTMSKQKRKHGDLSPPALAHPETLFVRPPRDFAIAEDITATSHEAPSSSHEAIGDVKAATHFKDNRAPMRALHPEEIFERSETLTESADTSTGNDLNKPMTFSTFRRYYYRSKLLDPRYDESGLDIEEDREGQRAIEAMKANNPMHHRHRRGSACSELNDLSDTILHHAMSSPCNRESRELVQDFDSGNASPNPRKRSKAYHFSDSTPGRLPVSPGGDDESLGKHPDTSSTSNQFCDTDEDMDFDDDGIDDDTLAALPEMTDFPLNSRHNVLPEKIFSPGVRASRSSGRFIDMHVNPLAPPSFIPSSIRTTSDMPQRQTNDSFNSIDDDDFFVAEQELKLEQQIAVKSRAPILTRSMSTIFPSLQSRTITGKSQPVVDHTVSDIRFLKPNIPASRLPAPTASINYAAQPPFSTQDALNEAFEAAEQRAVGTAVRHDAVGDHDVQMEER